MQIVTWDIKVKTYYFPSSLLVNQNGSYPYRSDGMESGMPGTDFLGSSCSQNDQPK